ncbi:hypothetical protein ASPACDRAFT_1858507 [Aspergillus aculeatus ATCC 16872]|uniref:Transcription factor domain-containing protein n=1 Tax=Aspergillus aculeatus (strain ATCC 16872 / CBS 172.66 / WB 5094) TaxID=690307 RepID=A0A1L9WNR3_ASPA1|nr:uncharacterized protein ASPACDRAFT_1858507 [Aspergillus aculeatus ATCC 16872]OJJ97781.1 hypothetical protein ASPACDRAFT_1858507 [Aspergillus aculeatus ATCC 16872]
MSGATGSSKRARDEDLEEGRPAVEKVAVCVIDVVSGSERRLEYITNKLDHLAEVVGRLSHEHSSHPTLVGLRLPLQPSLHQPSQSYFSAPTLAEGIESTLFAHVIFTAKCPQAAVMDPHLPPSNVPELTAALNSLWSTIAAQKQQNQTLESSQPFAKVLPQSLTSDFKDLPIPSLDRIMACLRLAYECSPSQLYWPFEFGSLGDFTHYVTRVCSPGPITEMELIIVHYVLAWLFTECANLTGGDPLLKQDYEVQALICRQSLETLLGSLSFHVATSLDAVCAMYMATIHCLQHGKPVTAWSFITRASLISQARRMERMTRYTRCRKYGRVFRALYDVAAVFVKTRDQGRMEVYGGEMGVGVAEGGELEGLGDLDAFLNWSGGGWK